MDGNSRRYVLINAMITGFIGGFFFAFLYVAFHFFNVTKVSYQQVLGFFSLEALWPEKWYGYVAFFIFIGLLSVVIASVYYVFFRKIRSWLFSAAFGLGLWLIFGLCIPILIYDLSFSKFYKSHSNVLNICMFLIYGLFIGYSIAYDEVMSEDHA